MTGMGIPWLTVSRILNHVEPSVTAVYDRHSYNAEKRDALERWSPAGAPVSFTQTVTARSQENGAFSATVQVAGTGPNRHPTVMLYSCCGLACRISTCGWRPA